MHGEPFACAALAVGAAGLQAEDTSLYTAQGTRIHMPHNTGHAQVMVNAGVVSIY